jgi:hypothetical protein
LKNLTFFKKHRILTALFLVLICIIIICFCLSPFIEVNFPGIKTAHSIFSIAFDKYDMMRVNKVEIETPIGVTIIENQSLIDDIIKNTLVAKHFEFQSIYYGHYIRLYRDDVLVRDMELAHNNCIRVYFSGRKHYLLGEYVDAGGYTTVSDELIDRIQHYLLEHGNSLEGRYGSYYE